MPRPHLRKAAAIVREHCAAENIPYTADDPRASRTRIVIAYLNRVGLVRARPVRLPRRSRSALIRGSLVRVRMPHPGRLRARKLVAFLVYPHGECPDRTVTLKAVPGSLPATVAIKSTG